MTPQLISIYALVAMFVVATALPINMGVLAFVGAFLVGTLLAGLSTKAIIGFFPGELFLTLVGITYLFALAQNNGTIDWLVGSAVRAVGDGWRRFRGSCSSLPRRSPQSARSARRRWRSSRRSRWALPSSTRSAPC